ncbi:phosphotransferase [Brevibacillus choshinensis]|uniref:phosphotransferase n=1 Tax=Brevibacillus choshinensis TaxID=54911 RepID=UPI002E1F6430|nr:phosphotransferase [Brevibacillus choshinensis]
MEALIRLIEEEYDLKVVSHKVERNTDKSLVVILKTSNGKLVGKCLFTPADRQEFILDAEEHLLRKGIHIPKTRKTKSNSRFIYWKGSPFIIQEWAPGPMLALNTPFRIKRTGATLGKIHAASVGFITSASEDYNAAITWEEEYEQDFATIQRWKNKHEQSEDPKHVIITTHLPFFLIAGKIASESLQNSSYYKRWKELPCSRHFLCHGDFNNGNLLSVKQKITVIDWEDVRYDFPSKDISRILSLMMRKHRKWNSRSFQHLLTGYLQENPLSRRQRHLMYVDLAFPHITERFLRQQQYVDMSEKEIAMFLKREIKKIAYMLEQMRALE